MVVGVAAASSVCRHIINEEGATYFHGAVAVVLRHCERSMSVSMSRQVYQRQLSTEDVW